MVVGWPRVETLDGSRIGEKESEDSVYVLPSSHSGLSAWYHYRGECPCKMYLSFKINVTNLQLPCVLLIC